MGRAERRRSGQRGPVSGRVTPKGTRPASPRVRPVAGQAPEASARYTPPTPREVKVTPRWVPPLMAVLLVLGALVIVLNYIDVLLPGATSNWYLLIGLGLVLGGILTATQLH